MKKIEIFDLWTIDEGETYVLTKKEDYYSVIFLLSIITFVIGMVVEHIL